MWIAIIAIASLLLAVTAVSPKKEVEDARWRGLGENAFPTSKYGDAVPIIFGTCEQKSPIVMWYGKFQPLANYIEKRTGLFSSTLVIDSYRYLIGFDLGICLGPNIVLEQIKKEGGVVVWDGRGGNEVGGPPGGAWESSGGYANISIQGFLDIGGGLEFFPGNFAQDASPFITTPSTQGGAHFQSGAAVENYPAMKGICHCVFVQFYIGDDNPVPPRFTFVVKNLSKNLHATYSVMVNNQDTNPMEIVYTALTQEWGMLGVDPALIDKVSFEAAALTLRAEGLGMSMIISQEQDVKKVIEECMRVADGVLYQDPSDGLFKVMLVRDNYDTEALLTLDSSNIVGKITDFGRTTWEQTFNQVRVNYQSRANNYQSQVVVASDHGNIKRTGGIRTTTINLPGVKEDVVARLIAERELKLLSSPLLKCTIKTNRVAKDLRPGDVFKLNWSPYGLTNAIMRVSEIDLGTLEDNTITIKCVEDKYADNIKSFEFPTKTEHVTIDLNAIETTEYLIYDPPLFLITDSDELTEETIELYKTNYKPMVLAKAPSEASTGFDLLLAPPEMSEKFKPVIVNQPYMGMGKLESDWDATLPENGAFSGYTDSAGMIVYGLTDDEIDNLVDNADFDEARDGSSLFYIPIGGGEIFCYVGFTNLGGGRVRFDKLYRGMLSTDLRNNDSDFFYKAEQKIFFIRRGSGVSESNTLPTNYQNVSYKIATRTPIGILDVSSIQAKSAIFQTAQQQRPLPPKGLALNGSPVASANTFFSNGFTLSWKPRSRLDYRLYAYQESTDSSYLEDLFYEIRVTGYINGVLTAVDLVTTSVNATSAYVDLSNFDNGQNMDVTISSRIPPSGMRSFPTFFTVST